MVVGGGKVDDFYYWFSPTTFWRWSYIVGADYWDVRGDESERGKKAKINDCL